VPPWWPPRTGLAGPDGPPGEGLVIVGAHGGSGCTTLAGLLAPACDAGTPGATGMCPAVVLRSGSVVVTARCTPAGAAQAVALAAAISARGIPPLAVAVISDGLPETADARYRYRLLDARVPVVRFPFVAALRAGADPAAVVLPRRARRALAEIRRLEALASAPRVGP
jgi:hypothetical protein